jgi:hypothetical protein
MKTFTDFLFLYEGGLMSVCCCTCSDYLAIVNMHPSAWGYVYPGCIGKYKTIFNKCLNRHRKRI